MGVNAQTASTFHIKYLCFGMQGSDTLHVAGILGELLLQLTIKLASIAARAKQHHRSMRPAAITHCLASSSHAESSERLEDVYFVAVAS